MNQLALLTVAAAVLSTPASAREATILKPIKPWNLHYAGESCQLIRTFGTADKPTTLVLERVSPNSGMSLMVYGSALRAKMDAGRGQAAFLPFADNRFEDGAIAETIAAKETAIYWTYVDFLPGQPRERTTTPPAEMGKRDLVHEASMRALEDSTTARVTGVEITEPGGRRTILQTGPLAKANAMMRECAREQMVAWGLDPAIQDKIVRSAVSKAPLARYFASSDYPTRAIFQGQQSIITARLVVGADGKVTRCTSLTRFRAPDFAEVVCRNLARARFEPAQLADGTPVPDFTVARVRFELP